MIGAILGDIIGSPYEFDRRRGFPSAAIPDIFMQASDVSLMRSERTKSGIVYTKVGP